jgi:septal ring factor EnvC (AmiA/AmiB activator)
MGSRDMRQPPRSPRAGRLAPALAAFAVTLTASVLGAGSAAAQTIDELNSRIAAAQSEAQTLGAQIEARTAALAAASARARAAAQREAALSSTLARGRERAAQLATEVATAERELAAARERLRRATDVLADRLVAIYKSGVPDAAALLLQADGFDDLATRAELLGRIQSADASLVARVRDLRAEVAAKLAAVEAAEARALAFNERVAAARNQIAAVRAGAETQAAALADARARQQAAVERLRSQVGTWTAEVGRLEQVAAQQAQQSAEQATQQAQQTVAGWVGDWAIPQAIVMCESGGSFGAINPSSGAGGAYQILPSTWRAYGGSGLPHQASPAEQHRIAAQIWRDSGSSAWVC